MQKQKGFTIIELIVVIAIIAVLAAIVMVNVTQYIAKGKDAAVKGNLASAMANAAVYYDANPTLGAVCADTTYGFKTAFDAAAAQYGAGSASCAGTTISATSSYWCACARLVSDNTKYYCVDSTGKKLEGTVACSTDCAAGSDYTCDGA
jgi:prepilin-type N-terminal cleavage/methylation domain-containing protein